MTMILQQLTRIVFAFFAISIVIGLDEPNVIELFDNDHIHLTIDYCPTIITDPDTPSQTLLSFTGRCICQYDTSSQSSFDCTSPGPTFLFHPGTTVHMTWYNIFEGTPSDPSLENEYRDISVWNIHTHGFHIDSEQDDVTLHLDPGTSHTYTYTIPEDHYPGFQWIHPHHHGSTSFYIHSGAFSAAIIEYDDQRAASEYEPELLNMRQNVLVMSSIYGADRRICNCNDGSWQQLFEDVTPREEVFSFCYEYCSFPQQERTAERGYEYDMDSNLGDEFKLFLINGQVEPVIDDMVANRWRRIRLLNAMNTYVLQMRLPVAQCEWFLLALDGIYLYENEPRDLSRAPYNGQFVLPPAGRADFAVSCPQGTYSVISSNVVVDRELTALPRMETNVLLFGLQVNALNSQFANVEGNDVTNLPDRFPDKPFYLRDLTQLPSNQRSDCECASFNGECEVEMRAQNGNHFINRLAFDVDEPMQALQKDAIYDFTLALNGHIYHQHVYPFQVLNTIGTGILGLAGDYMDTIAANDDVTITTGLYDFSGKMMVHCHNLPHEDEGMMTYYMVMNDLDTRTCTDLSPNIPTPNPTFQPTFLVTDEPTAEPTSAPTKEPTAEPTSAPTKEPTSSPTQSPTDSPTASPTDSPTLSPTKSPSPSPTPEPTEEPTNAPSNEPTKEPIAIANGFGFGLENIIESRAAIIETTTQAPTNIPTTNPTIVPTVNPTDQPTSVPTSNPTVIPTGNPTINPTTTPTVNPTIDPTTNPEDQTDTCCECVERGTRGTVGCAVDPDCEAIVAERVDERCRSRRWNQPCADEATGICNSVLPPCCDCLREDSNPGCNADAVCQTIICDNDPFCCGNDAGNEGTWDSICVHQATEVCNGDELPVCCGCTVLNDSGCSVDTECEANICGTDPFCCSLDADGIGTWDANCVELASNICSGDT